jgi:DNA-binding transcriptional LysR family regulator
MSERDRDRDFTEADPRPAGTGSAPRPHFPDELGGVDLRLLPSFLVLGQDLPFGRAASRLHIAQPTLSQQLKRLEQQLGMKLIERNTRRVELTFAGETLARELSSGLARVEDAILMTKQAVRVQGGAISIAAEADCIEQMRSSLRIYQQRHPAQRLTLMLRSEPELADTLVARGADAVLSCSHLQSRRFEAREVLRTEVGIAVRKTHPLASRASVETDDLVGEPLVIFDREESPSAYDEAVALVGGAARRTIITALTWTSAGTQEELLHVVSQRGGIAVVSRRIFERVALDELAFIPFGPPVLAPVWLIYAPTATALVKQFAAELEQMADAFEDRSDPSDRGGLTTQLPINPDHKGG